MTDPQREIDYPVRVVQRNGRFELSIPELLILVRSTNLADAYRQLLRDKKEVIDWAWTIGAFDKLPPTSLPTVSTSSTGSAILSFVREKPARCK